MAEAYYDGKRSVKPEDVTTIGFDARFPNTNQTKACWQNYVDFFRCRKIKGDDYPGCKQFLKAYLSLCPVQWVENWDEQRENGTFAYPGGL